MSRKPKVWMWMMVLAVLMLSNGSLVSAQSCPVGVMALYPIFPNHPQYNSKITLTYGVSTAVGTTTVLYGYDGSGNPVWWAPNLKTLSEGAYFTVSAEPPPGSTGLLKVTSTGAHVDCFGGFHVEMLPLCIDSDNDGVSPEITGSTRPAYVTCGAGLVDCNDANSNIRPGNPNPYCDCNPSDGYSQGTTEVCTGGLDEDCDNLIDNMDPDCSCVPTAEVCGDGLDNDCDNKYDCNDEDCYTSPACCTDADGDGYTAEGGNCGVKDCDDDITGETGCPASPAGCDQATSTCAVCTYPGATEFCDNTDNDCDGKTDEYCNPDAGYVFVTKNPINYYYYGVSGGNLKSGLAGAASGLEAADWICNLEAAKNPSVLGGRTFVAWLSDSTTDARDRINHASVPYMLTDGTMVALDWKDLLTADAQGKYLKHAITLDHEGNAPANPLQVWTGTSVAGNNYGFSTCNDWTSTLGSVYGEVGVIDNVAVDSRWTANGRQSCFNDAHLYCFEQLSENYCGNSIVEGTETCDSDAISCSDLEPGATGDATCLPDCTGYNTSSCTNIICGNGDLDAGEECDDGNSADGDGCDSNCVIEYCGDDIVQAGLGEECDDGAANSNTADACKTNCLLPYCGDNITDTVEECDDGNTDDNDGCTNQCRNAVCGDGIVRTEGENPETCDDGNTESCDGCAADCSRYDNVCGDGRVECAEECEGGDDCNAKCFSKKTFNIKIPKIADVYKARIHVLGVNVENLTIDIGDDGFIDYERTGLTEGLLIARIDADDLLNEKIASCMAAAGDECTVPVSVMADSGVVILGEFDFEFTNYWWDTSLIPDGQNYRVRITAVEDKYS